MITWSEAAFQHVAQRLIGARSCEAIAKSLGITDGSPYQVCHCPEKGAYLVATRDFQAGAEVLRDRPLLSVCRTRVFARCLRCAASCEKSSQQCTRCNAGWCTKACRQADVATHAFECQILQQLPASVRACLHLQCIQTHNVVTMLRGIAIKVADPDRWLQLCSLEDHRSKAELHDSRFPSWLEAARVVHRVLMDAGALDNIDNPMASAEDALKVLLVANVNAVGGVAVESGKASAPIAICPAFSRLEHSCLPNLCFYHEQQGPLELVARTRTPVLRGQNLSISYVLLDEPTHRRQAVLQRDKYFRCCCSRCVDTGDRSLFEAPGEICSLNCIARGCDGCKGLLRPRASNYDLLKTPWTCSVCNGSITFGEVEELEERIERSLDVAAKQAEATEQLLEQFNSYLPAGHYARFQLNAQLAELLLRPQERLILGGRAREVPTQLVKRVIHLYEQHVLPWAGQRVPLRTIQMRTSWSTVYYRVGQAQLVLSAQIGGAQHMRAALDAYEEALAETSLCMGEQFAAPLEKFVARIRSALSQQRA